MSKHRAPKQSKAKPVSRPLVTEIYVPPESINAREVERLRLIQEALEAAKVEDRKRLAAQVAADLEAAKPHSAWDRIREFLQKHLGGTAA